MGVGGYFVSLLFSLLTMIRNVYWFSVGLAAVITACAPAARPSGSRSGTSGLANYNGYTDDLSVVRPSYTPAGAPASRPATPAATATPVRKPEAETAPARKPAVTPAPAPAEPLHVNKRLDALLDTIAQQNRSIRYAPGYRIQVYVGNERQEADAVKLQIYQVFPELSPYLSYKQPTYRLKVGDFMRRFDAERYLSQLKQQFTAVILQPDKVDIRRSLLIK